MTGSSGLTPFDDAMLDARREREDAEVITTNHVCEYHKKNPSDWSYAGCTCSGSFSYRRKGFDQQEGES